MLRVLLAAFLVLSFLGLPFGAAAAQEDDGFVWLDANTRIKLKPIKAGAGATAPEKAPQKPEKKEKPRK